MSNKNWLLVLFLLPAALSGQSLEVKMQEAEAKLSTIKNEESKLLSELEEYKFQAIRNDLDRIGLPKTESCDEVIFHSAYALVYSEAYEQARWVAHIVLPDVKNGSEGRSNDFRPDELIKTGSSIESDYFLRIMQPDSTFKYDGFGFDRGHLAPSADFRYSKKALSESFLYSNMSPQVAELNRERWADLEDAVRQYAVLKNTPVFVVTGGVLHEGLKKIERGTNHITIPEFYFKVLLDPVNSAAIAFVMPNKSCDMPLTSYSCSIDSVEKITGLDFFYKMEDGIEADLEKKQEFTSWLGQRDQGDAAPLEAQTLQKNHFNTTQAEYYAGKNEIITVCGTVVSSKLSSKGNIFLNLDKKFPNQVFTVTIFKDNVINFSYSPDQFLEGKVICVKGKVADFNGTPSMVIENEKAIRIEE